jgi:hypothetical protein
MHFVTTIMAKDYCVRPEGITVLLHWLMTVSRPVARDTGSHSEGFLSNVKLWSFGHASGEDDSARADVIQRDDDGGRKLCSGSSVEL